MVVIGWFVVCLGNYEVGFYVVVVVMMVGMLFLFLLKIVEKCEVVESVVIFVGSFENMGILV